MSNNENNTAKNNTASNLDNDIEDVQNIVTDKSKSILNWFNNKIDYIEKEYTNSSDEETTGNPDRYNIATELIIQAACFYIGIALFIGLCLIPPFIIMLPYALPLTFMICIIANISFVIRFTKGTTKIMENKYKTMKERLDKSINIDGALDAVDS